MNASKPKIFLSYAHENIGMAKHLYNDLKRFGLEIWVDFESLLPGQHWQTAIENAIKQSQFYLVLLSTDSVTKRGFIQKEMKLAYDMLEQCAEDDIFLIPVRLDNCEPPLKMKDLQYIDLFPESEYHAGLKKILQVINPESLVLRSEAKSLSQADVTATIMLHDFYETFRNPGGKGFNHHYQIKKVQDQTVIFDQVTSLMWQQSGSYDLLDFEQAKNWIAELNQKGYAGYQDWRLPTLEEAMSLMEREERNNLYIDPVFDDRQSWVWTADPAAEDDGAWVVFFHGGLCSFSPFHQCYCVRAVRSGQHSVE